MTQAWYTFSRIDNFGTIDPAGPYWKPDSNIQLPANYPVTALLPGTVTSVQNNVSWGQTVITIKLDQPINGEATHTFYEHMGRATVSLGQHVNAGDLIGYNNSGNAAPLGFGLYNGDVYGSGPGWAQLQADLKPGGPGLLNPVKLLNAAKAGQLSGDPSQYSYTSSTGTNTGSSTGSGSGLDLRGFAVKVGIFLIALVVIGFGAYLTFKPQMEAAAGKVKGAAIKTAEVAAV